MGEKEVDNNKEKMAEDFDLEDEISTLVSKNVIPSRIAEKLKTKLKEKQVKITKEQLYVLVNKIKDMIDSYKSDSLQKAEVTANTGSELNINMEKLVATMEKLQDRIENLEKDLAENINKSFDNVVEKNYMKNSEQKEKTSSINLVTTEDIQVPDKITVQNFELDPLVNIPSDPENIIVLMKWLQYLIDKCGKSHLSKILDYYVDIGWISEDAKINLIDYSSGITEEGKRGETSRKEVYDLHSKDHIQSLLFIQKLKGRKFDKHFLDRVDGEISRMTKKDG